MNINKHEELTIQTEETKKFNCILDLAKNELYEFIALCENVYGKQDMTDGQVPMLFIIKALKEVMTEISEINKMSNKIFSEYILNVLESEKNILKNELRDNKETLENNKI